METTARYTQKSVRLPSVYDSPKSTPTRPHPYCNVHTRIPYGLGPGVSALKINSSTTYYGIATCIRLPPLASFPPPAIFTRLLCRVLRPPSLCRYKNTHPIPPQTPLVFFYFF